MDETLDPTGQVAPETDTPIERTPIELRALDMGWRPKEDFDGDEDDFIEAKEFVRRKPLFEKIEHQNKQIKAVTRALDGLKEHFTKVRETEFNRALAALKAERKQALSDGDGDRFEQADDKIKEVEEDLASVKAIAHETPIEKELPQEFTNWVSRNSWYNSTGYMRKFADDLGNRLGNEVKSGNMTTAEVLKEVEKQVRKEFPQKFTNPNKADAPDVASSRTQTSRSKNAEADLTEQERRVMNDLVRQKVLTKEEYIASLNSVKGKA